MAGQGAASLTMDEEGHIRVGHYVDIIRPQMDPLGESKELLILPGPEPIKQMNAGTDLQHQGPNSDRI